MTNYFSHDFNARNDIRLQNLVMNMGYEGLGLYWSVVEMLYEAGGKFELLQSKSIAFALHTDSTKIDQLISLVFDKDDKYFWSESVLKRLKMQKEISKVRKNAGKKRWENEAKKSSTPVDANAEQMLSKSTTIKEKKIKENKINKKKESIYATPQILDDQIFYEELIEKFPDKDVSLELEKMKDWLASSGSKKKDYGAFARNWLRKSDGGNSGKLREVIIRPSTEVQI